MSEKANCHIKTCLKSVGHRQKVSSTSYHYCYGRSTRGAPTNIISYRTNMGMKQIISNCDNFIVGF